MRVSLLKNTFIRNTYFTNIFRKILKTRFYKFEIIEIRSFYTRPNAVIIRECINDSCYTLKQCYYFFQLHISKKQTTTCNLKN